MFHVIISVDNYIGRHAYWSGTVYSLAMVSHDPNDSTKSHDVKILPSRPIAPA